jgi:hypothetical protein
MDSKELWVTNKELYWYISSYDKKILDNPINYEKLKESEIKIAETILKTIF